MLIKNAAIEFIADDRVVKVYFSRNISKEEIEQFIKSIADFAHDAYIYELTQFEYTVNIFLTKRLASDNDAVHSIKTVVEKFNNTIE